MNRKLFALMALAFVFVLTAVGCSSGASAGAPDQLPGDVVKAFYAWHLGEHTGPPKDARQSSYISSDLSKRIDEMYESPVPVDVISFVCAQDIPDQVEVIDSKIDGSHAIVTVKTSFGRFIELKLVARDAQWLIDDVICK